MSIKKQIFIISAVSLLFVGISFGQETYQFTRDLSVGSRGPDVVALQQILIARGFLNISAPTGYFGTLTKSAVGRWQLTVGLNGQGYFGPLSRAKMAQTVIYPGCTSTTAFSATTGVNCATGEKAPEPPRTTTEPPTETPGNEPIPVSEEATLPPSFDERVENQEDYGLDYNLTLIERSVQVLINEKRAEFGLGELMWDAAIADVARAHSLDQAEDNIRLTNPDFLCHYPLIRHEGIRGGYSLVDRFEDGEIKYWSAGENILMFSTAKNLVYTYKENDPPADCEEVPGFSSGEGTKEERLALFRSILQQSLEAVEGLEKIDWVNKEWRTYEEIGEKAVDLWMNSPGHRANILRSGFNYAGVGIAKVNDYLIMTQNFVGR